MSTLRRDESGQMLILAGVILVLGFVIVGSTLVQLQNVGETTARLQRESLVAEFAKVLATYNETLREVTDPGDANVAEFRARLDHVDETIRNLTTKRGLVIDAGLNAANTAVYSRASRCLTPTANSGGVLSGIDAGSFRLSIVGVVYDVFVTDGQESLKDTVYFRFFPCYSTVRYTPADDFFEELSNLDHEPPSGYPAGVEAPADGLTASFREKGDAGATETLTLRANGVTSNNNWLTGSDVQGAPNDLYATTTDESNLLTVDFDDPPLTGAAPSYVTFKLEGHIAVAPVDDTFNVTPVLNGVPGVPRTLTPLAVDTEMEYNITTRRPGGGSWSLPDIRDLRFEIRGKKGGLLVDGTWKADAAWLVVKRGAASNDGHAVFDVARAPDGNRHWLVANYTLPGDEAVKLSFWNVTTNEWDDRDDLPAASVMKRLYPAHHFDANSRVRFKLEFVTPGDATQSTLLVDEFRIKTKFL